MNKVITINLGGIAYQLEEAGCEALRTYLDSAAARLQGNPDRDEILSDIERAIGEKFRARMNNYKTVIETKEVTAVLIEMGTIEAESEDSAKAGTAAGTSSSADAGPGAPGSSSSRQAPRRLYRIYEGAMISGVCNGIAAYVNVDPTLVRLGFVLLTVFGGAGILVYVLMTVVVPEAHSPEEKAAASGTPFTAQEFIRRAKEGYYEAMKRFPRRNAHWYWKRRVKCGTGGAHRWGHYWQNYWSAHARIHPAMGFAVPLFSLLQGATTILCFCIFVSLLATGSIFGHGLPGDVPIWLAALLLMLIFGVVSGPLKAVRHACYYSFDQPRWAWSFIFLLDAMIWLGVFLVLAWLACHFFPEICNALQNVPTLAHQAADDVRSWWHHK